MSFIYLSKSIDYTTSRVNAKINLWTLGDDIVYQCKFIISEKCTTLYTYLMYSERDGNTRPPDLPHEKPVCRSGSNS